MGTPEYSSEIADSDEAIERWGSAAAGLDPLLASFTLEPFSTVRPHVPFYRFFHYPDVLDLRHSGFEVENFIPIFDSLDNARYSQAIQIHYLLHFQESILWSPRTASEFEFRIRAHLHRFGISDVPALLRKMLGRAFPDDSISALSVDLLNVYFWACLAEVARKYSWKERELADLADYLEYPLEVTGLLPEKKRDAA